MWAMANNRPLSRTPGRGPSRIANTGSKAPRKIVSSNSGASTTAVSASKARASGSRLPSTNSNSGLLPPGSPTRRTSNHPVSITTGVTINQPARASRRAESSGRTRHCIHPPSGALSMGNERSCRHRISRLGRAITP